MIEANKHSIIKVERAETNHMKEGKEEIVVRMILLKYSHFRIEVDYMNSHRRIWWGGRGGTGPPWSSRLILIRAKKGGLLGQKSLFIVLDWVIRASFAIAAPPSERIQIRLWILRQNSVLKDLKYKKELTIGMQNQPI